MEPDQLLPSGPTTTSSSRPTTSQSPAARTHKRTDLQTTATSPADSARRLDAAQPVATLRVRRSNIDCHLAAISRLHQHPGSRAPTACILLRMTFSTVILLVDAAAVRLLHHGAFRRHFARGDHRSWVVRQIPFKIIRASRKKDTAPLSCICALQRLHILRRSVRAQVKR
jgi:hypothetical protein